MRVTSSADVRDRVVLATLGRAHGIKGSIRARVYNTETALLDPGCVVRITPPDAEDPRAFVECSVEQCTRSGDGWVLKFAGVDDRDGSEELNGAVVWVPREELPSLEDGEFYLVDAPGYAVLDDKGALFGRVSRVEMYPTTDVLVVEREGGADVEIPVVEGVVVGVDHSAKSFTVTREALDALLES